ncbi:MAG: HNH endonuclease [Crocinitomicaceae bacterium]
MKFELDSTSRNNSDEDLISDLKSVAEKLGKNKVTIDEYNEMGRFHSSTLSRRFGSWFKCLEIAGLEKTRSRINIPNEDLFENLVDVWTKLERQPRYSDMYKPLSKFSAGTYEKRFGSWRKALEYFVDYMNGEEAPIEVPSKKKVSKRSTSRNINIRLRFMVLRRDNFKCKICGKSPANDPSIILHVDHIKAWAKGGETIIENLQTLCSTCNIGKSDLDMNEE